VARETGARFVPLGGKEFASFRVVAGREGEAQPAWELDVWDREGGSLEADLARRDFTVNAVAVGVGEDGGLVDPFGGVEDVAERRLRATTEESFRGDPLRVLRLPRFLVQLEGFTGDPATVALARRSVPGLARVAFERVRDELALVFGRDGSERGLAAMLDLGVYPSLWLGEPGAQVDEATRRRAAGAVESLGRLPERAAEVAALAPDAPHVDLPAARWTLTFSAFGEPDAADLPAGHSAVATVRGSDGAGEPSADPAALVERFRDRGFLTRDLAKRVSALEAESGIPPDERGRRRFLHRLGDAWPTAVACLGARLPDSARDDEAGWRQAARDLATLLAADADRILDPPRLLTGEDVQRLLDLPPGPGVGQALARLRQAQVDGLISTREEAEALLRWHRGP
jgi:tRNA nucleotidyltransferase/poly(A) polymerase